MKTGRELWEWAEDVAQGVMHNQEKMRDPRPGDVLTEAVAVAYLKGANDALLDEIARVKREGKEGQRA